MSPFFVTLQTGMDIYDAIDVLSKKRASGAPVLDEHGELAGLLTEKDCIRVLSNDAYATLARGKVADYMSDVKASVEIDMDLFGVAEVFLAHNFSVLPVMDHGRLVGRISRQDMLRAIQNLQRQLSKEKDAEEHELRVTQHPAGINQLQDLISKHKPENVAALFSTLNDEQS